MWYCPPQNSKLIKPFIKFKFKKYAFYKFCQNENTSFELGDLGRLDSDLDSCLGSNFIKSALNLSRSCNNRFMFRVQLYHALNLPGPVIIDSCTESSFIMLSTYPGPVIINSYLGPALICFRLSRSWNQLKSPSTNHIYLLNNQSFIFHLLSTPVWKKTGNRRVFWVRQKKIKINAYSIWKVNIMLNPRWILNKNYLYSDSHILNKVSM